jgi:FMN reductase
MTPIVVISGSPSSSSKTARLASLVTDSLTADGLPATHLQVRDLPPEALMHADFNHPAIVAALAQVAAAEGVVFATPTYKAAYSGLLKTFIDLFPQFGLTGKAVLPLATGGSLAHVMTLDYALRPVLHSLGARHVVQSHFMIESVFTPGETDFISEGKHRDMLFDAIGQFKAAILGFRVYGQARPPA